MDARTIVGFVAEAVPDPGLEVVPAVDQPTLAVPRERLVTVCRQLRDDPRLQFTLLAELTAVDHLPRDPRFEVVYHLASIGLVGQPAGTPAVPPARLRLKVPVPAHDPSVPTVSGLWASANWCEREVWDLFGIAFGGHPDLRRILLPDDWEGHPLRKDYPVQVNLPVKVYEPLQMTPEEFAANVRAARHQAAGAGRGAAPTRRVGEP
jgi:NADH-quinone oxidoreductase subunit C